jgi:hypothetical protein
MTALSGNLASGLPVLRVPVGNIRAFGELSIRITRLN